MVGQGARPTRSKIYIKVCGVPSPPKQVFQRSLLEGYHDKKF